MRNKYGVTFVMGMLSAMEYRLNFFLQIIGAIFPIAIQYYIWTAVFHNQERSELFGYSYGQLVLYTIVSGMVATLVTTRIEQPISADIKNGGLNMYLIRPIGYFGYRISMFFGQKVVQYAIIGVLIVGVLACMQLYGNASVEVGRTFAFFLALLFALALNFVLSYCICAIAFWLAEISYFFVITSLLVTLLSGGVFPIEVFGETWMRISELLPFQYTVYFPVNVLNGRVEASAIWPGIGIQWCWIAVLLLGSHLLWKLGLKRYAGTGG